MRTIFDLALSRPIGAPIIDRSLQDDPHLRAVLDQIKSDLPTFTRIEISNVAEYMYADRDQEWAMHDMPCIAPVFGRTWFEYDARPYGWRAESGHRIARFAHAVYTEWHDEDEEWEHVATGIVALDGFLPPMFVDTLRYRVGRDGSWVDREFTAAVSPLIQSDDVVGFFGPVPMALSFMHCKNVSVVDRPDDRTRQQRRADERRNVSAPATFKTLTIGNITRILNEHRPTENTGLKRALHICRGHFAEYTEDKPLFGKYSGRFWIPAHVRGSAEAGRVVKDYRVVPPTKNGEAA